MSAAIQVNHNPNGNVIITIKLVIASVASGGVQQEETVETPPSAEVVQTPRSIVLLDSNSDESTVFDAEDDTVQADSNNIDTIEMHGPTPYSLRSRVRVEDDNEDDQEYEVDYDLSQQVSNVRL